MQHKKLIEKTCAPCHGGVSPLDEQALQSYIQELGSNWNVIDNHHIEKEYTFKNFKEALSFANQVGDLAETEGHHPDMYISYGKVKIVIWTHKINGLSENDFILAAKCDEIL